jgi:hypothetical protein
LEAQLEAARVALEPFAKVSISKDKDESLTIVALPMLVYRNARTALSTLPRPAWQEEARWLLENAGYIVADAQFYKQEDEDKWQKHCDAFLLRYC